MDHPPLSRPVVFFLYWSLFIISIMTLLSGESLNIYIYTRQPLKRSFFSHDPLFSTWHHSKNGSHPCFATFILKFYLQTVNKLKFIVHPKLYTVFLLNSYLYRNSVWMYYNANVEKLESKTDNIRGEFIQGMSEWSILHFFEYTSTS